MVRKRTVSQILRARMEKVFLQRIFLNLKIKKAMLAKRELTIKFKKKALNKNHNSKFRKLKKIS